MTEKQIEAFKNRLRNYTFLQEEIEELNEELEYRWYNLTGLKGVAFDRIGGTTNESVKSQKKLKEYDEIEKIEKHIASNKKELATLDKMINQMGKFEKVMTIDKYIHNYTYEELSARCYMDKSTLKRRLDRELARIEYL